MSASWIQKLQDVFWSCPRAQKVWNYSGIFQPGFVGLFLSFLDLLWKMMMVDD